MGVTTLVNSLRTVDVSKEIPAVNVLEEMRKKSTDKQNPKPNNSQPKFNVKRTLIYRVIGAKVAYYRTLRQLSQRELASKANLSTSTLGRIERGKYNNGVSIATLLDIAEGLRIELSALVTFSEDEKKVWWESDKDML